MEIFADIFCLALRIPRQRRGIKSNYFVVVVFVLSGGGGEEEFSVVSSSESQRPKLFSRSCPGRNERKTVKADSFESKKFCIKVRSDVDISAGVGEIQFLLYLSR